LQEQDEAILMSNTPYTLCDVTAWLWSPWGLSRAYRPPC